MNSSKVAVITGSNTGIGLETARGIAETGATVVLACRNLDKAHVATADVRRTTGNEHVAVMPLDLASFHSIRHFVEEFKKNYERLDILVNNAALAPMKMFLTQEGFEGQFGVNHLGHFLLTNLLLPTIKASRPSRIVVVSSKLHKRGKIDFGSFRGKTKYWFLKAYAQSKLANVLFVKKLSMLLKETNVTVNAAHPGPIKSDIYRDIPQPLRAMILAVLQSAKKGARTSLHVALSDECGRVTGKYFANCKQAESSALAKDPVLAEELWNVSCDLCGIKPGWT